MLALHLVHLEKGLNGGALFPLRCSKTQV